MVKKTCSAALVLGMAIVFAEDPGGKVRYLAADGDDRNDGRTPATAWRTVQKLNSDLPSGGTALLRCGDVFYGPSSRHSAGDRSR